jgi:hypothetical protein
VPQSFYEFIREYQNSHECHGDDMIRILCDAVENGLDEQLGTIEATDLAIAKIKEQLSD